MYSGCFLKRKYFKSHKLTLSISIFNGLSFFFSVISEISLNYRLNRETGLLLYIRLLPSEMLSQILGGFILYMIFLEVIMHELIL